MPYDNQHYVPQFLLKNFARSGKLFELDVQFHCSKKQSAKGAAVSYRFYEDEDLEKIAGQEHFLELHFGKCEDVWARSLRRILKGVRGEADFRLSLEDRAILSGMIGWQAIRTPATRKTMEKIARASMEQWGVALSGISNAQTTTGQLPFQKEHVALLAFSPTAREVCVVVYNHYWTFLRSNGMGNFHIADYPFGKCSPLDQSLLRNGMGFGSPGIQISFPLAHDVILVMHERGHHVGWGKLDGMAGNLRTREELAFFNGLQAVAAVRHLYSLADDFSALATDE